MREYIMSRAQQPSDETVAEVAWHYYVKQHTQREISKLLGLSRPTIISYIRIAKERQIVCVKIAGTHFTVNDLTDKFKTLFDLDSVHIVPDEGLSEDELTHNVCEVAAHFLPNFVEEGDVLGVSWGQTISFVSERIPYWPIKNLTIRQIIGSMANPLLPTCESCSTEIARRLSATCINLNAPAVCTSAKLAAEIRKEPIIKEQLSNLTKCNKVIYSLSPCTSDTHVVQFKLATSKDISDYTDKGAVGIIAGRFIDAYGKPVLGELDTRMLGIDLVDLQNMNGLLVASGVEKTDACLAALRGGYVQSLVLDIRLAEEIIRKATK